MAETRIRNFNLNWPATGGGGVLRLVLEMDGEVIERADPPSALYRGN